MSIDSESYYDRHWQVRGGELAGSVVLREKIQRILSMIPPDVDTVLDVGCGDGAITNSLVHHYTVTAVDRSRQALTYLNPHIVSLQADAVSLPFPANHFDLVLSSELIEHIPGDDAMRAVEEMARCAGRYILLSVPNNERLRKRFTRCAACGYEFHIYSHFHTYNLKALRSLLPDWRLRGTQTCGVPDAPSFDTISRLRNKLTGWYFYVPQADISCPKCGASLRPLKRRLWQRIIDFCLRGVQRLGVVALGITSQPDWLIALFEAEQDSPLVGRSEQT